MQVTVELKPHIGVTQTPFGPVSVEHDQFIVMARGESTYQQVGYVGKQSGAPFNGLESFTIMPQPLKDEIVRQVVDQLGESRRVTEQPAGPWPDEDR